MKYKAKSLMSLNEMVQKGIKFTGDGYVVGYPIISGNDTYILNGVVEANDEYIAIEQWIPVFNETLKPATTRYRVIIPTVDSSYWQYHYLCKDGDIWHSDGLDNVELLTEEEIRKVDERYMVFAEPVLT